MGRRLGRNRRVRVTIGHGKQKRRLTLASDVIALRAVIPVALDTLAGARNGTTGLIARWSRNGVREYGALTAGHVALGGARPTIILNDGGSVFALKRLFAPDDPKTAPFDVALLQFSAADIALLNPALAWPNPPALAVPRAMDFEATTDDGDCQTISGNIPIDIAQAFASGVTEIGWPAVSKIIGFVATSAASSPFGPGTSGSAVRDRVTAPLGVLIAADQTKNYRIGFAHPVSELIQYLESQVPVDNLEIIGFC